jgi:hypothetical protein
MVAHSSAEFACLPCSSTVATPPSPERTALVFRVHAVASNVSVSPEASETVKSPLQVQLPSSKMQHWMSDDTVAPGGAHWAAEVAGPPCSVVVSVAPLSGNDSVFVTVHVDLENVTVAFGSSGNTAVKSLPHRQDVGPASPSPKAQQLLSPDGEELEEEQATKPRIDATSVMMGVRIPFEDTRGRGALMPIPFAPEKLASDQGEIQVAVQVPLADAVGVPPSTKMPPTRISPLTSIGGPASPPW